MAYLRFCVLIGLIACLAWPRFAAAEGEGVNGYPNWAERVLLEWENRARSDPQKDLANCPSGQCLESACYTTASPPRYLDQNLDHSSRFHADHMMINNYFSHPSECTLVSNIASLFPNSCGGAASCSCTQGALTTDQSAWTDPFVRMGMFNATVKSAGEIIAAGYDGPNDTFYAWLYEQAINTSCGDNENSQGHGNGHRYLILTNGNGPSAGAGYVPNSGSADFQSYAVMDFAGVSGDTYKIPSGSHYPQQAATIDAWANWNDSAGPSVAQINLDGVCSNMALQRGTQTNGAWHASITSASSGCHRYVFAFKDSGGKLVNYPTSGSLEIGDGSAACPDYSISAPPPCTAGANSNVLPQFPVRILDTRSGGSTADGMFAGAGAVGAGGVLNLTVAGRGGVPSSGAVAVALNITATGPTAPGYITVWPTGSNLPTASNLNFVAGQTIPNLVVTQIGSNGQVSLYNSAGSTNLIADVAGYFTSASNLNAINPIRVLDTRAHATTIDGQDAGIGALGAGAQLDLTIEGRGGLPASGIGAVIINVTETNPSAPGYVTVWPTGQSRPLASNLNFVPGQTIPNLVLSAVNSNGQISLYNSAGKTDLIGDVMGWLPSSSGVAPVVPARLLDTRYGGATIDGSFAGGGALGASSSVDLPVLSRGGVPASGVGAVVLNVTAIGPSAVGYITVWPTGNKRPTASNLNILPGQVIPNLVIALVGSNGSVSLFNSNGSTDIAVDVVGWLPPSS